LTLIRRLLAVLLVLATAAPALATTFVSEDFSSYAPGDLRNQPAGGLGLAGSWYANPIGGYVVSTQQALDVHSVGISGQAQIQMPGGVGVFPTDGASAYASFRFRIPSGAPDFGVSFSSAGLSWQFGVDRGAFALNGAADTGAVATGRDYLLVSRLTRSDAGDDTAVVWVDPASEAAAPLLSATASYLAAGMTDASNVLSVLAFSADQGFTIDDIRLGSSFADVISGAAAPAVPEPRALALLAVGLAALLLVRPRGA
jgi:hypothetical protein